MQTLGCKLAETVLLRAFEAEVRETFKDDFNSSVCQPIPVSSGKGIESAAQLAKRRRSYSGPFHLYGSGGLG